MSGRHAAIVGVLAQVGGGQLCCSLDLCPQMLVPSLTLLELEKLGPGPLSCCLHCFSPEDQLDSKALTSGELKCF